MVWFRDNLDGGGPGDRRRSVVNVSGAGGIGKSWLLRQFRAMAEQAGAIAAWSDDAEICVGEVMCRIAEQFAAQEQPLEHFAASYNLYCQRRHEIEASPQAGDGRGDRLAFAAEPWDLPAYVAQKARGWAGQRPPLKPVDVLTPLFLTDLARLAEWHLIVLFFDAYERTAVFLDSWLRDLLAGRHGEIPANLLFVIAGDHELDREAWAPHESAIGRLPLEPFTPEEAREFLASRGVTGEPLAEAILEVSDRLPLFLSTLASVRPEDPLLPRDRELTPVDCFLQWLRDPGQQRLVLDAALPRWLNHDLVAVLAGPDNASRQNATPQNVGRQNVGRLLTWVQGLPFVEARGDGWAYHKLVRGRMLDIKQGNDPQGWAEAHGKLAAFYERLRNGQGPGNGPGRENGPGLNNGQRQAYTLEALYHRLCEAPQAGIDAALNGFLAAIQVEPAFAWRWAQVVEQAGTDAHASRLHDWGQRLAAGLSAQEEDRYPQAIDVFSALLDAAALEGGGRASALDLRGAMRVLAGEYSGAAQDLSEAIHLAPESAQAWTLRGEAHRRLGNHQAAVVDLSRALELEPDDTWTLALRGAACHRLGRDEQALADLGRALELKPDDAWTLALRGEIYWGLERYPEALADLDQALQLQPDCLPALASRGNTYRLVGRYAEALADFNRVLELAPNSQWALARRGETRQQMGQPRQALADLNRALHLDPRDAFALASRGEALRRLGRYPEALADLNRALEIDPDDAWVLAHRGKTYRQLGRYGQALADLNRALELEPDDTWMLAERGATCLRLARYAEALTDLDRAVRLERDAARMADASLFAGRGETWRLAGRSRRALADLNQALEIEPDHAPALRSRGQTYRRLGRYPEALADLDRALELQPDNAFALRGRAETLRRLGHHSEALADFDRALELEPDNAWALARRGQTFAQVERYLEAVADFDRALELRPGDVWTLYCRARARQALGQAAEARADLAAAVDHAYQAAEARAHDGQNPFRAVVFRLAAVDG